MNSGPSNKLLLPRIELWEHVGLGLIISWPSGIIFTNQTGGTSCLAPEFEGVFVPIRNNCTEKERTLISPENDLWDYFTGPRWRGTGATNGLQEEDADFIDGLLQKVRLFPTICVDRSRLRDCQKRGFTSQSPETSRVILRCLADLLPTHGLGF
jgi:hypothetical protein